MKLHLVSHPKLAVALLLGAAVLVPFVLTAADPGSRPSTPVTVVQGVVEVLNDVLRQPYVKAADAAASTSPAVSFDIPDGKRLIIETIAFQALRPESDTAASNRMFMNPLVDGVRALVPLAVQYISEDGYMISSFPFPMRLDSAPGSNNELQFRRGFGSPGTLTVVVFGYLIDL